MNVINLAIQAAGLRAWPAQRMVNGDVRVEVPTQVGRTQVVNVTMGRDGDNDVVAFIWSQAGDMNVVADPWNALRLNASLTYGKVALRGNDVVVVHGLSDATAQLQEVGKALFWVAKAADDLEQRTYGAYADRF